MTRHRKVGRKRPTGHTFSQAPSVSMPRSKFSRTHGLKTTFNADDLVPILVDEMLPGDTFNLKLHAFVRMTTPIYPILDNLHLETFFFFVPNRLLWDNWEAFNGARTGPGDTDTSTQYTVPTITSAAGVSEGSLSDYMGIPTQVAGLTFNSLHHRAYNLTYNDWFRDENLIDEITVDTGDGPDTESNYVLKKRGKRHDYFTSCLPWPQKVFTTGGNATSVSLPLATTAPIQLKNGGIAGQLVRKVSDATIEPNETGFTTNAGAALNSSPYGSPVNIDVSTSHEVDLASATAATINDIRLAFQTQKLYERDARGGTRYTEILYQHFKVQSPDSRLMRPELLSVSSSPIQIVPVAQTTQAATPTSKDGLGNLGGYGVCYPKGHGFTYSAVEHGVILGLVNVRSDINYQQGLNRMWSRQTRFDFYWPSFAHLGEQTVLNKEIYAQGTAGAGADDNAFGYQARYDDYRYKPSMITGAFRSNATGAFDAWHLAQNFGALPVLNESFITSETPMSRVQAVSTEPDFFFDGLFKYNCVRPMPVFAVPGLVDHF